VSTENRGSNKIDEWNKKNEKMQDSKRLHKLQEQQESCAIA